MKIILYHLTLTCWLTLGFIQLAAQSSFFTNEKYPKNGLELQFGWHWIQNQDLVYSPLIYKGSSITSLALQYERFSKKGIHQITIGFDQSEVEAGALITFTEFDQSFSRKASETREVRLHYGYAHRLKNSDLFQLYIGGILEAQINVNTYNFGWSDDNGYLLSNSLQPWLLAQYQVSAKNRLGLEINFPLLSYLARPTYAIVDNHEIQHEGSDLSYLYQNGEWATLDSYQALDFSLVWDRRLSNTAAFQVGYDLSYTRYSQPLPITILKNKFNLGLSFIF